jgi:hypothetical protein
MSSSSGVTTQCSGPQDPGGQNGQMTIGRSEQDGQNKTVQNKAVAPLPGILADKTVKIRRSEQAVQNQTIRIRRSE